MPIIHRMRTVAIAAVLSLAVLVGGQHQAYAGQSVDWTVSEVSGDVLVKQEGGVSAAVSRGDLLATGSTIDTPADGRAVLTRGDTSMTISPNSEITLATDGGDGALTTIFQKIGAVLYKVEKQSDQHFEVETPYLAAIVKGTSFSIGVNRDTAVTHVVEGAVEVTSLGSRQTQLVRPGQTATVSSANGMQLEMSHLRGVSPETEVAVQTETEPRETGNAQSAASVVDRTLGVTVVDIAKVTDGLANAATARGQSGASGEAGSNAAASNSKSDSSPGLGLGLTGNSASVASVASVASGGGGGAAASGAPGQSVAASVAAAPGSINNNPNKGPCNNNGNGNGNANNNGNGNGAGSNC